MKFAFNPLHNRFDLVNTGEFDPAGTAAAAVAAHDSDAGAHSGTFDAAGAAAAAVTAHEAAGDPHPQYTTAAEADSAAASAVAGHEGASDPHPQYTTAAELVAYAQPHDSDLDAIATLTTTTFGRALLELADAAAGRTAFALGTMATQAANNVNITGGSVTGITDLAIADGGTGASTKEAAYDALSPMTTLGDTVYGGASGTGTRLAGNTTTTKKFQTQTGNGSVSAAPVWDTISSGDLTTALAAPPTIGGTTPAAITGTVVTATTGFAAPAGSVSAPGITFGDADTGVYAIGTTDVSVTTAGVHRALWIGGRYILGHTASINGGSANGLGFQIHATSALAGSDQFRWQNNATEIVIGANKSRGASVGTHSALSTNDAILRVIASGSDGTGFAISGDINFEVDAAVSSGVVPGRIKDRVANASGTLLTARRVNASGRTFIGGNTDPSSMLHLVAGTSSANTAPLQFSAGTNETTARAGCIEYNNNFYATKNGNVRLGIGGKLINEFADVGNVGTGEDDLHTHSIPATTLGTNGGELVIERSGTTVGHASDTRQIKEYFGGTAIFDSGTFTSTASGSWSLTARVMRDSASSVRTWTRFTFTGTTGITKTNYATVTGLTLGNAQTSKCTGQSAGVAVANNDVVCKTTSTRYLAPASL